MAGPVPHSVDHAHVIVSKEGLVVQRLATSIADREPEPACGRDEDLMPHSPEAIGIRTVLALDGERIDTVIRCPRQQHRTQRRRVGLGLHLEGLARELDPGIWYTPIR